MSTTDQAFFAAYASPATAEHGRPKATTVRRPATPQADRHHTGASIDSQYFDASWYRIDQQHTEHDGTPAPHLGKAARDEKAAEQPADVQSWDPTDWSASCFVMASSMPAAPMSASPMSAAPIVPPTSEREEVIDEVEPVESTTSVPRVEEFNEPAVRQTQVPARPWMALWEVDEFVWPDELLRLQVDQTDYFHYAGEKLRDASREGLKTLAVVTTREKEGCTTMAICLARAAAAAGARVALVDGNLDHPELGPKLGLDFSHGWQEAISAAGTLAEAAVMALDSGLTLLPLSATHRLSCLKDPRISTRLRELAAAFDLVIIDAGIAPAGDEEMFESGADCPVDAALVVRDLRRTSETETLVTASRLKSLGIDAIGIAENFLPRPGNQNAAA